MSAPMDFSEFRTLLNHIMMEHHPYRLHKGRKGVKYVDPHIDMRDGKVFALTFRGFGWEKTLHTQNECRDLPESLFDRCMDLLDEPMEDFYKEKS
jgi:hypothetical protein